LKVLHIHGYDIGGGAETVFNITRKNPLVEVNYSGYIKQSQDEEDKPDLDFRIYSDFPFPINTVYYLYSAHNRLVLEKFLSNHAIDIIHLHGFIGAISPSILTVIGKYKRKNKIKVIQTMHEFHLVCPNSVLFDYSKNEMCEKCLNSKYKVSIFTVGCERRGRLFSALKGIRSLISNNILCHKEILDLIISPSNIIKEKLIEGGIPGSKIAILRNPIAEMENPTNLVKENILCYFGRFSKEKNITFIIDAFSKWKERTDNDFCLYLIGSGDEERVIKKLASASRYNDSIKIFPFMPQKKLKPLLERVKYNLMASKWLENAPMAILEATSMEMLSLVPDIGGMKETVEEVVECGGIYKNGDYNSWAEQIEFLEKHYSSEIEKLRTRKKALIEEYGVNLYHKKLLEIYKSVQ
jgi:glycosyltransferase involved in cell wall biosynthesis